MGNDPFWQRLLAEAGEKPHAVSDEDIAAYVEGRLGRRERRLVEQHLNACSICQELADELRKAVAEEELLGAGDVTVPATDAARRAEDAADAPTPPYPRRPARPSRLSDFLAKLGEGFHRAPATSLAAVAAGFVFVAIVTVVLWTQNGQLPAVESCEAPKTSLAPALPAPPSGHAVAPPSHARPVPPPAVRSAPLPRAKPAPHSRRHTAPSVGHGPLLAPSGNGGGSTGPPGLPREARKRGPPAGLYAPEPSMPLLLGCELPGARKALKARGLSLSWTRYEYVRGAVPGTVVEQVLLPRGRVRLTLNASAPPAGGPTALRLERGASAEQISDMVGTLCHQWTSALVRAGTSWRWSAARRAYFALYDPGWLARVKASRTMNEGQAMRYDDAWSPGKMYVEVVEPISAAREGDDLLASFACRLNTFGERRGMARLVSETERLRWRFAKRRWWIVAESSTEAPLAPW